MNLKALIASKGAKIILGTVGGLALFHAGSVAGYFYAKGKLIEQYDERLEEEIERTREHFKQRIKVAEYETPEKAAEALGVKADEALQEYRGITVSDSTIEEARQLRHDAQERDKPVFRANGVATDPITGDILSRDEPQGPITRNIFEPRESPENDVDFAYADEIAARDPKKPYVISLEEWNDNDFQHEQVDLTYYEGDRILADPNDKEIALVEETIGWDNLRFGHRSNDNDVVYIRNEVYHLDMEVTRHEGKYGEIVAGFSGGQMIP
jgi:hypothetical protein